jgi:hypothetical protein
MSPQLSSPGDRNPRETDRDAELGIGRGRWIVRDIPVVIWLVFLLIVVGAPPRTARGALADDPPPRPGCGQPLDPRVVPVLRAGTAAHPDLARRPPQPRASGSDSSTPALSSSSSA